MPENNETTKTNKLKKRAVAVKAVKIGGFTILTVIVILLMINSLLTLFADHYYPTYGKYRLFAIVSDSMEPEIPTGNMIVCKVPESEDEIEVGTVITYELKYGDDYVTLITHRVISVNYNPSTGVTNYTTKGDNARGVDSYQPVFLDIVGIFEGKQCGFFGYFFGFLQSTEGTIALIVILLIIVITAIVVHFVNLVNLWRNAALLALKKSGSMLKDKQTDDVGTIADVIGIVMKEPNDKGDLLRKDKKLNWFVRTGKLPPRPYADDLDEYLAMLERQQKQDGGQNGEVVERHDGEADDLKSNDEL